LRRRQTFFAEKKNEGTDSGASQKPGLSHPERSMQNSLDSGGLAKVDAASRRIALQRALSTRVLSQTKPPGSLGMLESIGLKIALLQNTLTPSAENARICVFAGSHGIAHAGVSAYPPEVTMQMVANFLSGGAAICVLARAAGASLHIINTGVDGVPNPEWSGIHEYFNRSQRAGTRSFLQDKAMTPTECLAAIDAGREQVTIAKRDHIDVLAIGEMGIGNTTSAAALCSALLKLSPELVTGSGTGVDSSGLTRKQQVIAQALLKHGQTAPTSLDARYWLEAVGGYEIAAMSGAILEASRASLPIVIDGFIATTAALVASLLDSNALDVCFFAHKSEEKGHSIVLKQLGVTPILSLGMRLGEASGAALALPIIRASTRLLSEMATFESAGVSNRSQIQ
jgi:nicotinate-nucleotide--dimethylbenzimidazole phosphoribosyltransferase